MLGLFNEPEPEPEPIVSSGGGICWSTIFWGIMSLVGIVFNAFNIGFSIKLISLEILCSLCILYAVQCMCIGGCWMYSWLSPPLILITAILVLIVATWTSILSMIESKNIPASYKKATLAWQPGAVVKTGDILYGDDPKNFLGEGYVDASIEEPDTKARESMIATLKHRVNNMANLQEKKSGSGIGILSTLLGNLIPKQKQSAEQSVEQSVEQSAEQLHKERAEKSRIAQIL